MKSQHLFIGVAVAIVLLLAGGGVLLYGLSQNNAAPIFNGETTTGANESSFGDIPGVKVTPPPSLAEIADEIQADYPELAGLLENPELGSVYKDFYLAYQNGGETTALALAEQRGILTPNDEIVMTLVLDTEDSNTLITELEAEGVTVTGNFRNLVSIAIPMKLIREKAETEDPTEIIERISNLEHVVRLELPRKAVPKQEESILGQGVNVTLANIWHSKGITGKGVKVGVLDLGFGGYEDLLGTELPQNVTVKAFGDETLFDSDVHGTACAEIVHEMAPDAELYLAFYDGSDLAFGQAVEWLIGQEVDIISNSTGSNGFSPMDGTGFSAEMVDEAYNTGIFWVNAAGNEATSHYRGAFADSDGNTIHEFFPDTEVIPFIPFGPGFDTDIVLSWDDWDNANQDYDLILMDEEGTVLAESEDYQNGQDGAIPVEGFFYEFEDNEIYLLSIENHDGEARGDATFDLFIHNGEYHPDYLVAAHSLSAPADAKGAFAVGAVNWSDDALEPYSSQGPTSDGRIKPDVVAPSVVDSASYGDEPFNGTSAAAPHVAGAAALILQAIPEFTQNPDDLVGFLESRTLDLGENGIDNVFGSGRLNLGESPGTATETEATETEVAETEGAETEATETEEAPALAENIEPASTAQPAADVGLPAQVGIPGQSSPPAADNDDSNAVGFIVLFGLCLVCLSGMLLLVLIIAAIVLNRRKR